jgi:hypothetical protein
MVDAAELRIGRDEVVGEFRDGFHMAHLPQSGQGTKFN